MKDYYKKFEEDIALKKIRKLLTKVFLKYLNPVPEWFELRDIVKDCGYWIKEEDFKEEVENER